MNNTSPAMFHTRSRVEYHEYSLILLLYNYINELETFDENTGGNHILTDDTNFSKAAQFYQHIVTHYLCAKMELSMGLFMNPTHGVTD